MTKRFTTGMAQIEPRFILWRRVRLPLAVAIVLLVLLISGLLLRSFLIARSIGRDLDQAALLSAEDTLETHREALAILERLRGDYPDHDRVRALHAWELVLSALRYGATEPQLAAIAQALALVEGDGSPLAVAGRAGDALIRGDADAALALLGEQVQGREGIFVRALALASRGQVVEAIAALDQARQGTPPFVPALGELALLLRQAGRFNEAQVALGVLTKVSPQHETGVVETVLLTLDGNAADPEELERNLPSLSKGLAALSIGDAHPRLQAYDRFAQGRLSLLRGEVEPAMANLAAAAKVLTKSQAAATWLALARRRAGEHAAALEAIAAFPDDPTTDPALLQTRLDILVDLHRTADARAPLEVLSKSGRAEVSLARAALLYDNDDAGAAAALKQALEQGHAEAVLLLADLEVRRGEAERARGRLRQVKGAPQVQLCASAFLLQLEGQTKRARAQLLDASKQGGRCGARLAGLLLLDAGVSAEQRPFLVKALAEREDLLERVLLARMTFRTEGVAAARAELEQVRALEPQGALVLRQLALAYRELGLAEEASKVALWGVERSSGHPLVLATAAELAREGERLDEAQSLLERGLAVAPRSPFLLIEKAALLAKRGRFADAEEVAIEAAQPGPLFSDAACLRAEIQLRRGERDESQVRLRQAMAPGRRHSGARAEARLWTCAVELSMRRGPSALTRAKTSLHYLRQLPNQSAEIENVSGWVAQRDGRASEAVDRFRLAIELDPALRDAWSKLAGVGTLSDEERRLFESLWPGQEP